MPDRAPRIVIAGAGIAGLTAAIALQRAGFDPRVVEKSDRLEPVGAGIQLSPNATRLLDEIGVLDRLLPGTTEPVCVEMREARSLRRLAAVPLGSGGRARWHAPYLVTDRPALQAALLDAASGAGIGIETGIEVSDLAFPDAGGVGVTLWRAGAAMEMQADLLIGADGVWSALRRLAPEGRSVFAGRVAWRATLRAGTQPRDAFVAIAPGDRVSAFTHPRFHLISYPLAGGDINIVVIGKGAALREDWSQAATAQTLARILDGADRRITALAGQCDWTAWPLHIASPNCAWTNPAGFALIGDAAHAMLPFAAQGAAMAIEDAVTLARLVSRMEIPLALAAYERIRRPRIRRVAARGGLNQLAWNASGPLALARDLVFRLKGDGRLAADLDWLYGYDAGQV